MMEDYEHKKVESMDFWFSTYKEYILNSFDGQVPAITKFVETFGKTSDSSTELIWQFVHNVTKENHSHHNHGEVEPVVEKKNQATNAFLEAKKKHEQATDIV